MLLPVAAILLLIAGTQSSTASDRVRAEELARAGRTVEAIELFKHIVDLNPADVEARMWVARLDLRLGKTEEAEAGFRAVLRDHPSDVDARIGLGAALTRKGASAEALEVLRATEKDAGENSDLFGALARAYRRDGDDRSALEYFTRARSLAPADPDIRSGFEATALAYGHLIAFDGFGEFGIPEAEAASGALAVSLRVAPRVHLEGSARMQTRAGSSDATFGGGALWRAGRATTLEIRAAGGSENTSLPNANVSGGLMHYAGVTEVGGSVRWLSFAGANVAAVSPVLAWDADRWRLDGRYTYSRSSFEATGQSAGDHSVLLRETWRGCPRVWLNASYAYGIESFEQLTADRLGSLGATTVAGGIRINAPLLTVITTTWEHQWRSNDTSIDRVTVSLLRSFP
jgi:YaiO family outer membrane protein